ncbi:MAG: hypothetical protein KJO49_08770 [Bacteroidia bacterium]|nr:hypothetical protein [Bacteroidia bacterium]MBT8269317.1 hypothetical protein [Bacteroidia bacterium]
MRKSILINLKRTVFLGVVLFFISAISPPEKTGKKIFKLMRSGKVHKIEKYYLEKEEFIDFINGMESTPPQKQLDQMLRDYEEGIKVHLMGFENIDVENKSDLKIKRIEYDYQVAKPGKDEKILWPDSKAYKAVNTPSVQHKVNLTYFLEVNNKQYVMKFEMINYKGKWKLFHMLKQCLLYKNL